jgi:alpha 1,3-glucosidase
MRAVLWAAGLLSLGLPGALGVKTHDFKTCSQSGFCRRGRALSARAAATENWTSPYAVDGKSVRVEQGGAVLRAGVKSSLYPDVNFALEVRLHEDGVVRVRMDETGGLRQRYDGAAAWALTREPLLSSSTAWATNADSARAARDGIEVVVEYAPLRVALARGGVEHVVLNGRGLLHMEHFRKKPEAAIEDKLTEGTEQTVLGDAGAGATNPRAWFEGEEEDAFWEETFGSWTDAKPKGKC